MKIRIDHLYEGEHRLESRLEPEALDLDTAGFVEPIDVHILWDRRGNQVCMQFQVSTCQQAQCDRCLDDVRITLTGQVGIVVQFRDTVPPDMDDPDYRVVLPSDVEIDFTVDLRDAIMLAVPAKILCREDCKGLCPQCGQNWNHGDCDCESAVAAPQWEALRKLKKIP